jgi:hypothetical protein
MTDLVVTVPKWFWAKWIEEGDPAGASWSGQEWDFGFHKQTRPPIEAGERLYIVGHNRLRGYAPVVRVQRYEWGWAIVRRGDAVACTIEEPIPGFRGWRKPWWARERERPFANWQTADVDVRALRRV